MKLCNCEEHGNKLFLVTAYLYELKILVYANISTNSLFFSKLTKDENYNIIELDNQFLV